MLKNIKDYNLEELKQELISIGEKPFRATDRITTQMNILRKKKK